MKTNLRNIFSKIFLLLFCFGGYVAHADPPCPGPGPCPPPPDQAPIDTNIYVLVLIAVIFGTYIIYNHKQDKKRPI